MKPATGIASRATRAGFTAASFRLFGRVPGCVDRLARTTAATRSAGDDAATSLRRWQRSKARPSRPPAPQPAPRRLTAGPPAFSQDKASRLPRDLQESGARFVERVDQAAPGHA